VWYSGVDVRAGLALGSRNKYTCVQNCGRENFESALVKSSYDIDEASWCNV
jgi:hypothetical protein